MPLFPCPQTVVDHRRNSIVPSVTWLPHRPNRCGPWLCVPASRLVCLCRGSEATGVAAEPSPPRGGVCPVIAPPPQPAARPPRRLTIARRGRTMARLALALYWKPMSQTTGVKSNAPHKTRIFLEGLLAVASGKHGVNAAWCGNHTSLCRYARMGGMIQCPGRLPAASLLFSCRLTLFCPPSSFPAPMFLPAPPSCTLIRTGHIWS